MAEEFFSINRIWIFPVGVQNNIAERGRDDGGIKTSGGGITLDKGSTLYLSGESRVQHNHSDEVGGGISVGSREWGPTNVLNMDGGIVQSNTSGGTGGGIFVQAKYFSVELRRLILVAVRF